MNRVVISDTSCLIALASIDRIGLLQVLFSEVVTTAEVEQEFGKQLPIWIKLRQPINTDQQLELERTLGKGESSAIALAIEIPDSLVIIDEKQGRRVAMQLGLEVIGTLRVLLLAKQDGIIDNLKRAIAELQGHGFRLDKDVIQDILREAGEV